MLPDFLVIGAEKAGTTWLYEVLSEHDDVYLSDVKELSFFNYRRSNLEVTDRFETLGLDWYKAFFKGRSGQAVAGDISPMYLCDERAPQRIADLLPSVKLVAILRDPAERALSHYWMAFNKGETTGTFDEVMDREDEAIIRRGLYGSQLDRYLGLFPSAQIKVLVFEDVMADRAGALADLAGFLGIPEGAFADETLSTVVNGATAYRSARFYRWMVGGGAWLRRSSIGGAIATRLKRAGLYDVVKSANAVDFKKPKLTADQKERLASYYAADRARVEKILKRPITAWAQPADLRTSA